LGIPLPSEPGYLKAVNPKDPRPAPPGNGEPEKKLRPQAIPPPGMGMGQLAKKLGWKEKWMDSRVE
jgi:hypothetical protein